VNIDLGPALRRAILQHGELAALRRRRDTLEAAGFQGDRRSALCAVARIAGTRSVPGSASAGAPCSGSYAISGHDQHGRWWLLVTRRHLATTTRPSGRRLRHGTTTRSENGASRRRSVVGKLPNVRTKTDAAWR
jgi:hypothetical protein